MLTCSDYRELLGFQANFVLYGGFSYFAIFILFAIAVFGLLVWLQKRGFARQERLAKEKAQEA